MNPFKNLVVNLQATGPAAVMCGWIICLTCFGIFAPDTTAAKSASAGLLVFGGALMAAMATFSRPAA